MVIWQLPCPSFSTHAYGAAQRIAAQGVLPVDTHVGLLFFTLHFCPGLQGKYLQLFLSTHTDLPSALKRQVFPLAHFLVQGSG